MNLSRKIERPRQINEIVLERLRDDIVNGVLQLGEKISEQQLADAYEVTKAPIRAAYGRLQSEGLVEIRPQSGTYVFRPTHEALRSLCELRIALELEAARLSIQRAPLRLSQLVTENYAQMLVALSRDDSNTYHQLDTALHLIFFELADSPYLYETYRARVSSAFAALRNRFSQARPHNEFSIRQHQEIRDRVVAADLPGLQSILREHVEHTETYYEAFLATG